MKYSEVASPVYFLRDTGDPMQDLRRNFSCYTSAWCKTEKDAVADHPFQNAILPPRQDPETKLWCSNPEPGLSSFAFHDQKTFARAIMHMKGYDHSDVDRVAVFTSMDYELSSGADGEDTFTNGKFVGWLSREASWADFISLTV